jgi:hypothetical protein
MKKVHKILRLNMAVCKVENKTWAYTAVWSWKKVNCVNCLKARPKK